MERKEERENSKGEGERKSKRVEVGGTEVNRSWRKEERKAEEGQGNLEGGWREVGGR
jgi:hypothetical protein